MSEVTNTPPQNAPAPSMTTEPNNPSARAKPSSLAELSRLLNEERATQARERGEDQSTTPPPDGKAKAKPPKTLQEAAERLGVDVAELYALEVGMPDGVKPIPLGKMKDAYTAQDEHTVQRLRWEEERSSQEGELMRSRAELTELLAALPPEAIKPEVMNKIRERHETVLKKERAETLRVIPSWNDEAVASQDMAGMREHLMRAGFPANYLKNVTDHRTMRYIRENYLREKRINEALSKVGRSPDPSPHAPSNRETRQGSTQTRGRRGVTSQVEQIKSILSSD